MTEKALRRDHPARYQRVLGDVFDNAVAKIDEEKRKQTGAVEVIWAAFKEKLSKFPGIRANHCGKEISLSNQMEPRKFKITDNGDGSVHVFEEGNSVLGQASPEEAMEALGHYCARFCIAKMQCPSRHDWQSR